MGNGSNLLTKFSQKLFEDTTTQAEFVHALCHTQSYAPAILWCQPRPLELPFLPESALSWQPAFVDRLPLGTKPGQHPLHEQGHFYCLDFSSVFAASILGAIDTPIRSVLDM
ncbi:MAG TPA: hypothetical protein V6C65_25125, partial [Allocoleopsis sp.]